jgi:hypothetical protein
MYQQVQEPHAIISFAPPVPTMFLQVQITQFCSEHVHFSSNFIDTSTLKYLSAIVMVLYGMHPVVLCSRLNEAVYTAIIYIYYIHTFGSRDSSVGIATGYGTTEESEFESRWGQEFSLLYVVHTGSGAHPAS